MFLDQNLMLISNQFKDFIYHERIQRYYAFNDQVHKNISKFKRSLRKFFEECSEPVWVLSTASSRKKALKSSTFDHAVVLRIVYLDCVSKSHHLIEAKVLLTTELTAILKAKIIFASIFILISFGN